VLGEELPDQPAALWAGETRSALSICLDHLEIDLHADFLERLGEELSGSN
jgi:hypothetical protein